MRGGLLVAAAPDILFLQDTDGDGRADRREVLLTGFGEGNQQLRVNGLIWGGRQLDLRRQRPQRRRRSAGRTIRRKRPSRSAAAIFAFGPTAASSKPRPGAASSDWAATIGASGSSRGTRSRCGTPCWRRRSWIAIRNWPIWPAATLPTPATTPECLPISPAPQTFNAEPTDFYNALCGLTIFRGDALGPDYVGDRAGLRIAAQSGPPPQAGRPTVRRSSPSGPFPIANFWPRPILGFIPSFWPPGPTVPCTSPISIAAGSSIPSGWPGSPPASTIDWREGAATAAFGGSAAATLPQREAKSRPPGSRNSCSIGAGADQQKRLAPRHRPAIARRRAGPPPRSSP